MHLRSKNPNNYKFYKRLPEKKLDPQLFAPCKVAVVQSEHPDVVDKEETRRSTMSSTDFADRGL